MKHIFYLLVILISLGLLSACIGGNNGESAENAPSEAASQFTPPPFRQKEIKNMEALPQEKYSPYQAFLTEGPLIPGLFEGAVPQGMAFAGEAELMIIANYMFDERASNLTYVSMNDFDLKKTVWLENRDGSPHKGHLGGLAVSSRTLWIASGDFFYPIDLKEALEAGDGDTMRLPHPLKTEVSCATATAYHNVLYIGEFRSRDGSYTTPQSHHFKSPGGETNRALVAAFELDTQTDRIRAEQIADGIATPDYFLSIPDEVQGEAFFGDTIVLSLSYGRRNDSRLAAYRSPLGAEAANEFIFESGQSVPVWSLDSSNLLNEITAPPMTEGIVNYEGALAVLFESGSEKYRRTARLPQDRIHLLDQEVFSASRNP